MDYSQLGLKYKKQVPTSQPIPVQHTPIKNLGDEDSEEITTQYIIDNKPKAKIVREFLKYNISFNCDEDDLQFELAGNDDLSD